MGGWRGLEPPSWTGGNPRLDRESYLLKCTPHSGVHKNIYQGIPMAIIIIWILNLRIKDG